MSSANPYQTCSLLLGFPSLSVNKNLDTVNSCQVLQPCIGKHGEFHFVVVEK